MGVVLWTAAVLLVLVSALAARTGDSLGATVVQTLAACAATVAVAAALLHLLRTPLTRWAERNLRSLTGAELVRAMSPREVLDIVLARVYPSEPDRRELITWLLGGPGRRTDGGDTVVSVDTSIHYRIESVDETHSITRQEASYRYAFPQDTYQFVLFVTADRAVVTMLGEARVHPLHDAWVVSTQDDFDAFEPTLAKTLQAGMTYTDGGDCRHTVAPVPVVAEEIAFREHDQYLRMPEGFDRDTVRIFVVDLHKLVEDHAVDRIEAVTLHSSNVEDVDLGFVDWTPPHPCHVTTVSFDLSGLLRPELGLVYQVALYGLGTSRVPGSQWSRLGDSVSVPVHAWMLPGHHVSLTYRAVRPGEEIADDAGATDP